jgi:hypothetical protein
MPMWGIILSLIALGIPIVIMFFVAIFSLIFETKWFERLMTEKSVEYIYDGHHFTGLEGLQKK